MKPKKPARPATAVPAWQATGVSRTSPSTFGSLDLSASLARGALSDWLASNLEALEADSAEAAASQSEDRRWYGEIGVALITDVRAAVRREDAKRAAEAALKLGLLVRQWQDKDHVEPHYLARMKGLKGRKDGGSRTILREHPGDRLLRQFREWKRAVPGTTREAAYAAIAAANQGSDSDKDTKDIVKKAILRAERRERERLNRSK
jgi:hypothetical protein